MAQTLILPLNDMRITADYKTQIYKNQYGFSHYGADCADKERRDFSVYGMGNGKVVACGLDGATEKDRLGNCIVVVYDNVRCNDGVVRDLACRMFHFDKILCKAGDFITSSTMIGKYGNTGQYSNGAHLHIEFDTDVKYPQYAVGIASSGKIIKRGTSDTTLSPFDVLWVGSGQKIYAEPKSISGGRVNLKSTKLPSVSNEIDLNAQLSATISERDYYKGLVDSIRKLLG